MIRKTLATPRDTKPSTMLAPCINDLVDTLNMAGLKLVMSKGMILVSPATLLTEEHAALIRANRPALADWLFERQPLTTRLDEAFTALCNMDCDLEDILSKAANHQRAFRSAINHVSHAIDLIFEIRDAKEEIRRKPS